LLRATSSEKVGQKLAKPERKKQKPEAEVKANTAAAGTPGAAKGLTGISA